MIKFVSKTTDFISKMMEFALDFALTMMDFMQVPLALQRVAGDLISKMMHF